MDELLCASIDEQVRSLVRRFTSIEIHAIKGGEDAKQLLAKLNGIFENTGVSFTDCKITGIWLPPQMDAQRAELTKLNTILLLNETNADFQEQALRKQNDIEIKNIQKEIEQMEIQENGRRVMGLVTRQQESLATNLKAEQDIANAERLCQVALFQAEAERKRTKNAQEKDTQEVLNAARRQVLDAKLQADENFADNVAVAFTELANAREKAEAINLAEEVESAVGPQVRIQRAHEIALQSKKILAVLAAQGDYNIVGPAGDAVIEALIGGQDLDSAVQKLNT